MSLNLISHKLNLTLSISSKPAHVASSSFFGSFMSSHHRCCSTLKFFRLFITVLIFSISYQIKFPTKPLSHHGVIDALNFTVLSLHHFPQYQIFLCASIAAVRFFPNVLLLQDLVLQEFWHEVSIGRKTFWYGLFCINSIDYNIPKLNFLLQKWAVAARNRDKENIVDTSWLFCHRTLGNIAIFKHTTPGSRKLHKFQIDGIWNLSDTYGSLHGPIPNIVYIIIGFHLSRASLIIGRGVACSLAVRRR